MYISIYTPADIFFNLLTTPFRIRIKMTTS
jgi:hypothetical protein